MSNKNSLEPKQNETQLEEVGQSLFGLAKAPAVIENHQDHRGRNF